MSAIIKCDNVSIRYITGDFKDIGIKEYLIRRLKGEYHVTEFWADRHVTFELQPGDMLGIIGSNGAGKSTLLKAISGIMVPTEGTVERHGKIAALLGAGERLRRRPHGAREHLPARGDARVQPCVRRRDLRLDHRLRRAARLSGPPVQAAFERHEEPPGLLDRQPGRPRGPHPRRGALGGRRGVPQEERGEDAPDHRRRSHDDPGEPFGRAGAGAVQQGTLARPRPPESPSAPTCRGCATPTKPISTRAGFRGPTSYLRSTSRHPRRHRPGNLPVLWRGRGPALPIHLPTLRPPHLRPPQPRVPPPPTGGRMQAAPCGRGAGAFAGFPRRRASPSSHSRCSRPSSR